MTEIQKFIEALKGDSIDVYHETCEESKTIKHTVGNLTLEFWLQYEVEVKNYLPATHTNPEECDFVFHNTKHEDIALYKGAEMLEITDQELHEIDCILDKLLY